MQDVRRGRDLGGLWGVGVHGQQLWEGMWQSNGSGRRRLAQAEPLSAPCPVPPARLCRWGYPMALPWGGGPDGSVLCSGAGRDSACLARAMSQWLCPSGCVLAACWDDATARKAKPLGATPLLCGMAGGALPPRIKWVWMKLSAAYSHSSCPCNACSSLGLVFGRGEVGG